MRATILAILVSAWVNLALCTEVEQPEKDDSFHARVSEIIYLMWDVQDALREDRFDKVVQLKGDEIEERLKKLIDEAEEREKREGDGGGPKPKRDSKPTPERFREHTHDVIDTTNWNIGLNKSLRDGIIQVYSRELPILWRRRMTAYLVSVAHEEMKRALEAKPDEHAARVKK